MSNSKSRLTLAILNLVFLAATLVVNTLANSLPIGGLDTGQLSDNLPNLFVPAGLTFSIWGVIFILVLIFAVYGLVCALRDRKNGTDTATFLDKIGIWFVLSCVANMSWIFGWHYQILPLSMVIMLALLGTLITIYLRQNIGLSTVSNQEKYLTHLPFSVYLGWISIATIANVTALAVANGVDGFSSIAVTLTIIMLIIGLGLALVMAFQRRDIFYGLVVAWAFLGIYLKRNEAGDQSIATVALVCMIVILLAAGVQVVRKRVY